MSKLFDKQISSVSGIIIISLIALLLGGMVVWQYFGMIKEWVEIGEEKITRLKKEMAEKGFSGFVNVIPAEFMMDRGGNLSLTLKNEAEFPVFIIGFYTTNKSYTKDGKTLQPGKEASFTLQNIVDEEEGRPYTIRLNVYYQNVLTGKNIDNFGILSGIVGEYEPVSEELTEIDPYGADVPDCINSKGVKYSTTGPKSASWFIWGGCARNKYYNVTPDEELVLHVHTDSCAGCVCYHPNFYIYEYRNEAWEEIKYFDLPDVKGITEDVFYTPFSDKVRIYANDCFYLDVYAGDIEKIEQEIAKKVEARQKLAEGLLNEFMDSRFKMDEAKALIYLTENAREQFLGLEPELTLVNANFLSFEISQLRKIDETKFRFIVETKIKGEPGYSVEAIDVVDIMGDFFIDSVELAG